MGSSITRPIFHFSLLPLFLPSLVRLFMFPTLDTLGILAHFRHSPFCILSSSSHHSSIPAFRFHPTTIPSRPPSCPAVAIGLRRRNPWRRRIIPQTPLNSLSFSAHLSIIHFQFLALAGVSIFDSETALRFRRRETRMPCIKRIKAPFPRARDVGLCRYRDSHWRGLRGK